MVDYLLDWLHNLLVMVATISGIGLLGYVCLRELYPDSISPIQQALGTIVSLISGINLWPVVVLALAFFVLGFTLPHPESPV